MRRCLESAVKAVYWFMNINKAACRLVSTCSKEGNGNETSFRITPTAWGLSRITSNEAVYGVRAV
jgi:hypothetical protein